MEDGQRLDLNKENDTKNTLQWKKSEKRKSTLLTKPKHPYNTILRILYNNFAKYTHYIFLVYYFVMKVYYVVAQW